MKKIIYLICNRSSKNEEGNINIHLTNFQIRITRSYFFIGKSKDRTLNKHENKEKYENLNIIIHEQLKMVRLIHLESFDYVTGDVVAIRFGYEC